MIIEDAAQLAVWASCSNMAANTGDKQTRLGLMHEASYARISFLGPKDARRWMHVLMKGYLVSL